MVKKKEPRQPKVNKYVAKATKSDEGDGANKEEDQEGGAEEEVIAISESDDEERESAPVAEKLEATPTMDTTLDDSCEASAPPCPPKAPPPSVPPGLVSEQEETVQTEPELPPPPPEATPSAAEEAQVFWPATASTVEETQVIDLTSPQKQVVDLTSPQSDNSCPPKAPPPLPPADAAKAMEADGGDVGAGPQTPPPPPPPPTEECVVVDLTAPPAKASPPSAPPDSWEGGNIAEAKAPPPTVPPDSWEQIPEEPPRLAESPSEPFAPSPKGPPPPPPASARPPSNMLHAERDGADIALQALRSMGRPAAANAGGRWGGPPPPPNEPHPQSQPPEIQQQASASDIVPEGGCLAWLPLGNTGRLQLCLRWDSSYEGLLSSSSSICQEVAQAGSGDAVSEADLNDSYLDTLLVNHCGWRDSLPMKAWVAAGRYAGMSAIGTGSNVRSRRRTARLALAIAIISDHEDFSVEKINEWPAPFPDLVDQARRLKVYAVDQAANGYIRFDQAALRPPPPDIPVEQSQHRIPPSAAVGSQWRPQPTTAPSRVSQPAFAPASNLHEQQFQNQQRAAAQRLDDPRLAGIPRECLLDPFCELKPWEQGGGNSLWPYCSACNCWSDQSHVAGQRHAKKIANAGYAMGATGQIAIADTPAWTMPNPVAQPRGAQLGLRPLPPAPPAGPPASAAPERRAPEKPTLEQIYEFNSLFAHFDWNTVQYPSATRWN